MTEQEIIQAIKDATGTGWGIRSFGIRTDSRAYAVGDELPNSYDWNIEEIEGIDRKPLPGTCATGFGYLWFDGEQDDIDTVRKALTINARYEGKHRYLIGGLDDYYGEDEAEVIIRNAEVIAVIC